MIEVVQLDLLAALAHAQIHDRSKVLSRRDDGGEDYRLREGDDLVWLWKERWVGDQDLVFGICNQPCFEGHCRGRDDDIGRKLLLQPLTKDIHMQQAQKSASKPKSKRIGALLDARHAGVVES